MIYEASYDSAGAFTAEMKGTSTLGRDLEKEIIQLNRSHSRFLVICEASYDSTVAFTTEMKGISTLGRDVEKEIIHLNR